MTEIPPILFIVFNRPDVTLRVWDSIRRQRPSTLYVAADGPRPDKSGELESCENVRTIVSKVDWPCRVKYLFSKENKGCAVGVSSAISWFFENEEMGIILEDDCLPDDSFYSFCGELLERYKGDPRVMGISGNNFQHRGGVTIKESYYFSKYVHVWGWATWRRAWVHHDLLTTAWPQVKSEGGDLSFYDSRIEKYVFRRDFDFIHELPGYTWDVQWLLCCWMQSSLMIVPSRNLVKNIGFESDHTHTMAERLFVRLTPLETMGRIIHPVYIIRNVLADKFTFKRWYKPSFLYAIYRILPKKVQSIIVRCYNVACRFMIVSSQRKQT